MTCSRREFSGAILLPLESRRPSRVSQLVAAVVFVGSEWVRSWQLAGFPEVGLSVTAALRIAQNASLELAFGLPELGCRSVGCTSVGEVGD
jgi:hypothetical protein